MPAFREAMKVEDYAGAYIVLPEGLEVMTDTVKFNSPCGPRAKFKMLISGVAFPQAPINSNLIRFPKFSRPSKCETTRKQKTRKILSTNEPCETNSDPKRPASLNESQCDAMLAA
jgi:hypothetical protein